MKRSIGKWMLFAVLLVPLGGCGAVLGAASGLSRPPAQSSALDECSSEPCSPRAD